MIRIKKKAAGVEKRRNWGIIQSSPYQEIEIGKKRRVPGSPPYRAQREGRFLGRLRGIVENLGTLDLPGQSRGDYGGMLSRKKNSQEYL